MRASVSGPSPYALRLTNDLSEIELLEFALEPVLELL